MKRNNLLSICLLFTIISFSACASMDQVLQNTYGQMAEAPSKGQGVIVGHINAMASQYERFKEENLFSSVSTVFHKRKSFEILSRSSYRKDGYFVWSLPPGIYRMENLMVTYGPGLKYSGPLLSSGGDIEIKANEIQFLGDFTLELFEKERMDANNNCILSSLIRNEACFDVFFKDDTVAIKDFLKKFGYGEDFVFISLNIYPKNSLANKPKEPVQEYKRTIHVNAYGQGRTTAFDQLDREKTIDNKTEQDWTKLKQGLSPNEVYYSLGKPKSVNISDQLEIWNYVSGSVTFKNNHLDSWKY